MNRVDRKRFSVSLEILECKSAESRTPLCAFLKYSMLVTFFPPSCLSIICFSGKSSLLNALLDEAAVLPTSGSRGCTAAVVELLFNSEILHKCDDPKQIPLYKGVVEFMQLEDWRKELKVLVAECSTQEKTVYVRPPEDQTMPDAAAAWTKIDQVYGRGTMENFKGMATNYAYNRLANDNRVVRLLTVTQPGATYNSITVTEGEVLSGSEQAMDYLQPYEKMKGTPRRYKKACAKSFRNKINSYVYRKGNGEQAQTWPLIRKVTLNGPWGVLSTGACLVDLPGVRDANAARAKVSESYLQNCNHIAVVAPIKRAVDDGTAKELLGEQFKRRLLMDGQYGVSPGFIFFAFLVYLRAFLISNPLLSYRCRTFSSFVRRPMIWRQQRRCVTTQMSQNELTEGGKR